MLGELVFWSARTIVFVMHDMQVCYSLKVVKVADVTKQEKNNDNNNNSNNNNK